MLIGDKQRDALQETYDLLRVLYLRGYPYPNMCLKAATHLKEAFPEFIIVEVPCE